LTRLLVQIATVAFFAVLTALTAAGPAVAKAAAKEPHIYWANASGDTIGSANLEGSAVNQSFIAGAHSPEDVLVHGNHIYWTNVFGCPRTGACEGTIGVATLKGTHVSESLIHAFQPEGLAIAGKYIYWSNQGSNTIGRAKLNGTSVNDDFIAGASGPDGVVINQQSIYWANAFSNTIGRANLEGTSVNQSFITGASMPEGMATEGQYLYWANHNGRSIGRATVEGAAVNESFIANAGALPNRVAVAGEYIYWTSYLEPYPSAGTIGRAKLDGSNVTDDFIESLDSPCGVAIS
jgi:hypothetical protein